MPPTTEKSEYHACVNSKPSVRLEKEVRSELRTVGEMMSCRQNLRTMSLMITWISPDEIVSKRSV